MSPSLHSRRHKMETTAVMRENRNLVRVKNTSISSQHACNSQKNHINVLQFKLDIQWLDFLFLNCFQLCSLFLEVSRSLHHNKIHIRNPFQFLRSFHQRLYFFFFPSSTPVLKEIVSCILKDYFFSVGSIFTQQN